MFDFANQVVLITGASRGIGRALAFEFAQGGANLALVARHAQALQALQADLSSSYPSLHVEVFPLDVSYEDKVKETVSHIEKSFGKINVLINNAGITKDNLILRLSALDWEEVLRTNLVGAFLFTKYVARPMMKQGGGRIINMASIVGLVGNAGQANYAAAKAGLIALTKTTAKELASRNILVNAVAPGWIETDMTKDLPQDVKDKALDKILLKRLGTPQDVAQVCLFLASEASRYITGQTIVVDGGMAV